MTLGLRTPLVPTGQGRGCPAGPATGTGALKVLGGAVHVCKMSPVTWAEVPLDVTVVVRICSTPLNVPVSVGTSQPVARLLSRSIKIWKLDVAAEAACAKPIVSSRRAKAILTLAGVQKLMGKSPRLTPRAHLQTEGQPRRAIRRSVQDGMGGLLFRSTHPGFYSRRPLRG